MVPNTLSDVLIPSNPGSWIEAISGAKFHTLSVGSGNTLDFPDKQSFEIAGPSINNSGVIRFKSGVSMSSVGIDDNVVISGGGTIIMLRDIESIANSPTRLVNLDNTILGNLNISHTFENHGTFIGGPGHIALSVWPGSSVINTGYIASDSGSSIAFNGGTVDNTGGTIEALDGGVLLLPNYAFGGIWKTSGTGQAQMLASSSIANLTLDGQFEFGKASTTASQDADLYGLIQNRRTIEVSPRSGNSARLRVRGASPVTLSGGGTIHLANGGAWLTSSGASLVTDNTISGVGEIGFINLTTSGRLIAESGGELHLHSVRAVVTSLVDIRPGSHMLLAGAGALDTTSGSLQVDGALEMANGSLSATGIAGGGELDQAGGQISARSLRIHGASMSGGISTITAGGGTAGTSRLNALSITGTGQLDLTDHDLILDYDSTTPIDPQNIRMLLASAYAAGAWTGPGLASSAAGASASPNKTALGYLDNLAGAFTEFSGQGVDDTSILIKYTRAGDANLDGLTNLFDLVALSKHWQMPGLWEDGDFNYDGIVNSTDLGLLAMNWRSGEQPLNQALDELGLPPLAVPEPALLGILPISLLIPRRRPLLRTAAA